MAVVLMVAWIAAAVAVSAAPRHPRSGAGVIFCAGGNANPDDDWVDGNQVVLVDLSEGTCTSTTLPLLATYLGVGITAGDMNCNPGGPNSPHSFINANDALKCRTIVAALNTRLGGSAFSCHGEAINVNADLCDATVAALNIGIRATRAPTLPPTRPPTVPPTRPPTAPLTRPHLRRPSHRRPDACAQSCEVHQWHDVPARGAHRNHRPDMFGV